MSGPAVEAADEPPKRPVRHLTGDDLWKWCDRLTLPVRHRLVRENGHAEWLTLPSLFDQLEDDLAHSGNGGGGRTKPGSRPPLNTNILSLLGAIGEVVNEAVVGEGLEKRDTLASNLRQLTAHLIADLAGAPDDLEWWVRLVRGWAVEAQTMLPGEDDGVAQRPIRGFACPDCETWTIQRVQDGESYRDPAVVLVFREQLVRYAMCRACGANWFRGDALAGLTTALADYGLRRIA